MIRFGVGVQVKQTHHVVAVDEDFFERSAGRRLRVWA